MIEIGANLTELIFGIATLVVIVIIIRTDT